MRAPAAKRRDAISDVRVTAESGRAGPALMRAFISHLAHLRERQLGICLPQLADVIEDLMEELFQCGDVIRGA